MNTILYITGYIVFSALLINTLWTFYDRKNLDGRQMVFSILFRLPIVVLSYLFIFALSNHIGQRNAMEKADKLFPPW